MKAYYESIDKIILFLCCTTIYFIRPMAEPIVIIILISLTISALLSYFEKFLWLRYFLYLLFFILTIINLEFVFFIPLLIYDLINEERKQALILPTIPFILLLINYDLYTIFLFVIVMVIAIFIRFKSSDIMTYKARYYNLLDETKELSYKLKKQNQDLLEKQDNEIQIATLNERNRIAREIHDNVGHLLSSALLQIGALLASPQNAALAPPLRQVKDTLSQGMDSIRISVHHLYDTAIDLNLKLSELTDSFSFCQINCRCSINMQPTPRQSYALIAIVKEALSNVMKHSNATLVEVQLREHPSFYQLIIRDNGTQLSSHFDKETQLLMTAQSGIGLKNIAQRVDLLSGHFQIKTQQGFEIFVTIPKA